MHTSVLLKEVVSGLSPKKGGLYVDGTLGDGGHSEALCRASSGKATIIGIDQDSGSIAAAKKKLSGLSCKFHFAEENFRNLDRVMDSLGYGEADGIILDLGLSSRQLEDSGRGFSFQRRDEPLLMTFKKNPNGDDLSAREILEEWDEENIADIIFAYGEEKRAKKIARAITEWRQSKKFETTGDLLDAIEKAIPKRGRIHPATKTFQALRMAVNDEWRALQEGLKKGLLRLKTRGRMAVITFHSVEDREVKKFYKEKEREGKAVLINKKVITPKKEELLLNKRVRSAKLRVIEKIKN